MEHFILKIVYILSILLTYTTGQCHFGNETSRLFCSNITVNDFKLFADKLNTNVDSLYLFKTKITAINKLMLNNDHLKTITHMEVEDNQITLIEDNVFDEYSSLQTFILRENIKSWSIKINTFRGAVNLKHLVIDHSSLSSIEPGSFFDLNNLEYVGITYSACSSLQPSTFMGLDNINTLVFEASKITTVPSGAFFGIDSLTSLSLSYNNIILLNNNAFKGLSRLRTLNLSKNPIKELNYPAFSGLMSLEVLDLTMTGITETNWTELKRYMPNLRSVLLTTL